MTEPYQSNIRHFLAFSSARCILCGQPVEAVHYCPVETRIREIVRDELAKSVQQRSPESGK